jgi:hypothetical protein
MAKRTNRVASVIACVAALGLATGVSANHWELKTKNAVTYATEIFGEGAANLEITLAKDTDTDTDVDSTNDMVEGNAATSVELEMRVPSTMTVGSDSQAVVTFTLTGAAFGDTIGIDDFYTTSNIGIEAGSKMEGRSGDSSVSVRVKPGADIAGATADAAIVGANVVGIVGLRIPSLEGATGLSTAGKSVTVGAEVELYATSATGNFPKEVCRPTTLGREADDTATPPVPAAAPVSGCASDNPTDRPDAQDMVATSKQALTFDGADGTGGDIDLGDRSSLAKVAGKEVTMIQLASLTHTAAEGAKQKNGTDDFTDTDGGDANIEISVSGNLRDGDSVFFDQDGNEKMGDREGLDIANGMAGGVFRLDNAPGTGNVYYMPDGETDMTRTTFTTTFEVVYDETSHISPKAEKGTAPLGYDGVSRQGRAYAIPNAGMDDVGNVRIKCEAGSTAMCTVFLECNGQDGEAFFGELDDQITGGETMVLQAEAIGDVLGDTWAGRLSCDILSSQPASVQVLVRSGEALINNTYVDGAL